MSPSTKSGIQTSADGTSYIPSSTRPDGSTRKEIRVRPGYRPPEDVETYKNRSAEAWKSRGSSGVPGVETAELGNASNQVKSKNARRREAAKKKQDENAESTMEDAVDTDLSANIQKIDIAGQTPLDNSVRVSQLEAEKDSDTAVEEMERQKKIRNQLKKLRAVRELKEKKVAGEKLSHDQLMKVSKEEELLRDLKKLSYEGPEMIQNLASVDPLRKSTG